MMGRLSCVQIRLCIQMRFSNGNGSFRVVRERRDVQAIIEAIS